MNTTYLLTIRLGSFTLCTAFETVFLAERAQIAALAGGATSATIKAAERTQRAGYVN